MIEDSKKQQIRREVAGHLALQSLSDKQAKSRRILEKLFEHPRFQGAKTVFFYMAMPEEVQTSLMIEGALAQGKTVALPVTDSKKKEINFFDIGNCHELKPGVYGILEPEPLPSKALGPEKADCIVVPGVAFDRQNNRLGHGAGFYDKFLKSVRKDTWKVALAYAFQVVDNVPSEAHDVPVDTVITEI